MKININIETDIETCVHCPFWGLDSAQNIQYCSYKHQDLDTSKTSHPAVPDWCPFIVKEENDMDPAITR